MSQTYDLLDLFAEHETLVFDVALKDRAGAALGTAATAAVSMVVCSDVARDVVVFQITVADGGVALKDALTAVFQFKPPEAKRGLLVARTIYYYDIWSVDASNGRLHQVDGALRLKHAARET